MTKEEAKAKLRRAERDLRRANIVLEMNEQGVAEIEKEIEKLQKIINKPDRWQMEEQLVRFKTAELAKEKGFNIHCIECYLPDGESTLDLDKRLSKDNRIYAPTQSLLQKWLREEHDVLVYVNPKSHHFFQSHIITQDNEILGDRGDNWEDVLEDGLYIALQEV